MARATYILGLGSIILGQLTPSLAQVVTDVVSITDTSTIISCADTVTNCPGKSTATGYGAGVTSTPSVASEVASETSSWVASSTPATYTAPAAEASTVTVTETVTGDCGASAGYEVASSSSSSTNSMWWPAASETGNCVPMSSFPDLPTKTFFSCLWSSFVYSSKHILSF